MAGVRSLFKELLRPLRLVAAVVTTCKPLTADVTWTGGCQAIREVAGLLTVAQLSATLGVSGLAAVLHNIVSTRHRVKKHVSWR